MEPFVQNITQPGSEYFVFFVIGTLLIGLIIGSFLNMIIYRLPLIIFENWRLDCYDFLKLTSPPIAQKIDLLCPKRSICPSCHYVIPLRYNIPLLGFLFLRGRCFYCKTPISLRYPIIEILAAIVTPIVLLQFGVNSLGFCILMLSYLLIIIAAIDFEHLIIPDNLNYIGIWAGLLVNISIFDISPLTTAEMAIVGAVAGYLILWSLYWVFKLLAKKEGFGHGDFKLTALFGAWLGLYNIFPILIIASLLAILSSSIGYIIYKHRLDQPFPFGPYLALAGWLVLLFGHYWPINNLVLL